LLCACAKIDPKLLRLAGVLSGMPPVHVAQINIEFFTYRKIPRKRPQEEDVFTI
jgi:hypothetical protein